MPTDPVGRFSMQDGLIRGVQSSILGQRRIMLIDGHEACPPDEFGFKNIAVVDAKDELHFNIRHQAWSSITWDLMQSSSFQQLLFS